MIILLVDGQVSTIRNDVPGGYRTRCTAGRVIAGRLESLAELVCVTLIRVLVFLAIGALVTLGRFGFPRSSRVGFLGVLLVVGELVDLIRASVESFAISAGVRGTRKLKATTSNINMSNRVLRLKVVNDIVHRSMKRPETMAFFSFIGL